MSWLRSPHDRGITSDGSSRWHDMFWVWGVTEWATSLSSVTLSLIKLFWFCPSCLHRIWWNTVGLPKTSTFILFSPTLKVTGGGLAIPDLQTRCCVVPRRCSKTWIYCVDLEDLTMFHVVSSGGLDKLQTPDLWAPNESLHPTPRF